MTNKPEMTVAVEQPPSESVPVVTLWDSVIRLYRTGSNRLPDIALLFQWLTLFKDEERTF